MKSQDNPNFKSLALIRPIWEMWARWEHVQQNHMLWLLESNWHCCGVATYVQRSVFFLNKRVVEAQEGSAYSTCAPRSAHRFQIYALCALTLRNTVVRIGARSARTQIWRNLTTNIPSSASVENIFSSAGESTLGWQFFKWGKFIRWVLFYLT